jgi:hypothetical protein
MNTASPGRTFGEVRSGNAFFSLVTPFDFRVSGPKSVKRDRNCAFQRRWTWICGHRKKPEVVPGIRKLRDTDRLRQSSVLRSTTKPQHFPSASRPATLWATMMDDTGQFLPLFSTSFLLRSGSGYCHASVHRGQTSSTKPPTLETLLRDG